MSLENTWQQNEGKDDMLSKILQDEHFDNFHSKLPLKKLKKNLVTGIVWAVLVTVIYIVLFFFISLWQVHVGLAILIIFNLWIMILSWNLYRGINDNITPHNSLRQELEKNYNGFQKWWSIQERLGLFVYPVGAAAGFITGGVLGSGKSVEAFLYNPRMLTILCITVLILVPFCYYGARWMYNYAYGKHLKKIKSFIDELSV